MPAMDQRLLTSDVHRLTIAGFATASAILAWAPVRWLIETWRDPSYQSSGLTYLVAILALVAWSATSPRLAGNGTARAAALWILIAAAILRLVSQVAAINVIGGAALALDVFALLTWFGFAHRAQPVSPFWLSVLFLFTLPVERIAQRVVGYPMQEVSAFGACQMLAPVFADLVCDGVRLQVSGQDVLVDLPCSGTASLMLGLAVVVGLNALFRPSLRRATLIIAATFVMSIIGNALRIAALAVGLALADRTGIDVMAHPLHDLIGLVSIMISLAPVLWLVRTRPTPEALRPELAAGGRVFARPRALPILSAGLVGLALVIVGLPRQALDVSRTLDHAPLPVSLGGAIKRAEPLTSLEQAYFEQYGGTAQKAIYGPMALTLVQTTSPLRHLHAPDDCLRGLGYNVSFLGTWFSPVPTALYRAEDGEGRAWRVAVTFNASTGFATSNVAEAIWHWLKNPGSEWRSVQRITPWTLDDATRTAFEMAAVAALDLTPSH